MFLVHQIFWVRVIPKIVGRIAAPACKDADYW